MSGSIKNVLSVVFLKNDVCDIYVLVSVLRIMIIILVIVVI